MVMSEFIRIIIIGNLDNKFPGIYAFELPQRCWDENGNIIYLSSQWFSKLVNCLSCYH